MQRDNFVTHNLESTPLEIKTDRALGSEDEIMLTFETASGNSEAGFKITFPARYSVPFIRFFACRNHDHYFYNNIIPKMPMIMLLRGIT